MGRNFGVTNNLECKKLTINGLSGVENWGIGTKMRIHILLVSEMFFFTYFGLFLEGTHFGTSRTQL